MSDETTLLPCPFCGGEAQIVEGMYSSFQEGYAVRCRHCALTLGASGRLGECYEWSCSFATEAEAITAWNTRTDYHGYEQAAIEAWKSIKAWNTRATHGTLTAEQVCETVEKHWHDLPDEHDMPEATALPEYSYNWQAIADELNAELGSGTCKLIDTTSPGNDDYWNSAKCSECGAEFTCAIFGRSSDTPDADYCPSCGRKVVDQ